MRRGGGQGLWNAGLAAHTHIHVHLCILAMKVQDKDNFK